MSLFFLLALWACQKDPVAPSPPPPLPASKLDIVWQVPITPDTARYSTSPWALVEGGIAFGIDFALPTAYIEMREAATGAFRWKYDQFDRPVDGFLRYHVVPLNNKVIINDWDETHCVDAQSGQPDWAIDVSPQGGEPIITTIGDYVYKANYTGSKPKSTSESVVRAHYLQGRWDTLLTIAAEDSFYLNVKPPTLWVNPQGDSILIVRDNGLYDGLWEGRTNLANLYAWNMRTRQYEWSRKDFHNEWALAIGPPIVDGDRLYIHSRYRLYCVNLSDGILVWKKEFPDDIQFANLVLHGDLVIMHGDDRGIWAVDKHNGAQRWRNNTTIGTVNGMECFEGVVYFVSSGSGLLYAVDAETGATIWAEYSRTKRSGASFGLSDVVIDPVNRLLYTSDSYYMMCIKLPE
jgi:outer membrane protein assembly factor BamB